MEMVAFSTPYDQLNRQDRQANKANISAHRVLTHVVEGFIIQESNFPFTADDDEEDYDPLHNSNHDHNGDIDMETGSEAHSPLSIDESNDVFYESNYLPGHCEQCGNVTEIHHQRGPRRFCSTSCARRYSVSCSRKMMAYHARMKSPRGRQPSTNNITGVQGHRKALHSTSRINIDHGFEPSTVNAAVQVNEFDVPSMHFDWTRGEVEPLWIYEHVEEAKWDVEQVANYIRSLTGCEEYADAFVTEEIDGQALMLLREEHMVVALKMKLGPALKIVAKVNAMKREAYKKLTN
ncbi:polyhomeotic-like protein 2 [Actinia tenebrosa]|uniref:Polyhomeotic-like protein 2 n=1 Tax=Actinia tenebrosa TaxID=6105 RepID=A0A6P8IEM9_ACTTE|nr:polyhomeotic-like protein 2 [Actinia tenebrosa]